MGSHLLRHPSWKYRNVPVTSESRTDASLSAALEPERRNSLTPQCQPPRIQVQRKMTRKLRHPERRFTRVFHPQKVTPGAEGQQVCSFVVT